MLVTSPQNDNLADRLHASKTSLEDLALGRQIELSGVPGSAHVQDQKQHKNPPSAGETTTTQVRYHQTRRLHSVGQSPGLLTQPPGLSPHTTSYSPSTKTVSISMPTMSNL